MTNSYKVSQVQAFQLSAKGCATEFTLGLAVGQPQALVLCVCVCVWGDTQNETKNVCIMISFRATSKNCPVLIFIRQSKIAVGVKFYIMSIY